jgi:tRNA-2-methylthio-N6-dimethylallyladenosine synthase
LLRKFISVYLPRAKIMKQVHISTFGCQMNDRDSELMAQILAEHDYRVTEFPEEADLILINTCSIRQKAEEKAYSLLGRLKNLKTRRPDLIIGVGGCVAQQEGERLLERIPYLDLVFGTRWISRLPGLVEAVEKERCRLSRTHMDPMVDYRPSGPVFRSSSVKASVTIMQGCNNYCAYCVVPYVRGPEVSRPVRDILQEVRTLVAQGVKEVLLLGQNVNSYGRPGEEGQDFVQLLERLEEIEALERIRFTTSHPKDLSPALIRCFGRHPKLCEHIHLPFQSGSDRVLARMNRRYSRGLYLEQIAALRDRCPGIAITADALVGFPGETERDFEQTLDLIQTVQFDNLFSFKYSDRPPARAAHLPDKIQAVEIGRRLTELQGLQQGITLARNQALEGTLQTLLMEGSSRKSDRQWMGRTRTNKIVNVAVSGIAAGTSLTVRIDRGYAHSLKGTMIPTLQ